MKIGCGGNLPGNMDDKVVAALHAWIEAHEEEMLEALRGMLRIPSLEAEAEPNAPFGAENRKALDYALALAQSAGMRTVDLEGYIGYAEFGEGKPMILSLGHLDVVPVGPGWKHEPFGAEIDGEYVYARGATDDKGPTIASFFAMRALKEVGPALGVRFRQAFGCNEESGFRCVHRYMETEEAPTFGVAPDSGWPCCYAEKGIASIRVDFPLGGGELELLSAEGGQRPNIVIDRLVARARVSPAIRGLVEAKLADAWDANVSTAWEGDVLTVTARGKAAHGSTPFMGDSSATRAFRFLLELAPPDSEQYYRELLEATHPSGVGIGVHGREDVTGDLTSNVGIVSTEAGHVRLLANLRYPSSWTGEEILAKSRGYATKLSSSPSVTLLGDSKALYFPIDSPLVSTIISVYRSETGDMAEPFTMGGGTYARAVPNTVSIGTGWTGDGKAHETDERLKVAHLAKMAKIYAHIFYRLGVLAAGG
jgi:succinyl-diaminopimelate desuccinylase